MDEMCRQRDGAAHSPLVNYCRIKPRRRNLMGEINMAPDESSDPFKIRRAPNGRYYVWGNGSDRVRQDRDRQDRRIATFS